MANTKKIRVIGTKQFIDAETGEIEDFNVISQEEQDFNFDKFWITHILFAIDEFGSQKMKLLFYLISKRDRGSNTVIKTVRELAAETGINKNTINSTLRILEKHKIIRRKIGVIFISPDVIFNGGHKKRMNVLIQYRAVAQAAEQEEEAQPKALKPSPINVNDLPEGFAVKPKREKKIRAARQGV